LCLILLARFHSEPVRLFPAALGTCACPLAGYRATFMVAFASLDSFPASIRKAFFSLELILCIVVYNYNNSGAIFDMQFINESIENHNYLNNKI
jgi:hypothetical protein